MKTAAEALEERLINEVIHREGDYVNHPSDRGGPTRYGITEEVAREDGYEGPMRELPVERAYSIYKRLYWTAPGFDKIAPLSLRIAEELFDTGVNAGVSRASKFLQRSLNVLNRKGQAYPDLEVDGDLGDKSYMALAAYLASRGPRPEAELVLLRALEGLQASHYIGLAEKNESQEDFMYGWLRTRVQLK